MKVAIGLKAHSGWAAAVVIGNAGSGFELIDRRRIDLVADPTSWLSKQPYHAAEDMSSKDGEKHVARSIESTNLIAIREMRDLAERLRQYGHDIAACAVLVPSPMPAWSTAEILAVHFRMHKAEGVLFPEALAYAVLACKLNLAKIPEKALSDNAKEVFGPNLTGVLDKLTALGKAAGPPWAKDQKTAALAAAIALGV